MIRVLIVDDSAVVCHHLAHLLSSEEEIQVVGIARDGEEALELVGRLKPDVITMDLIMPRVNGVEATRRIMQTQPTPIVIVSSLKDSPLCFRALEAGALTAVEKLPSVRDPYYPVAAQRLIDTVRAMAQVQVVRRWRLSAGETEQRLFSNRCCPSLVDVEVVAIGASTGGPPVLQTLLAQLPPEYDIPLLIVQHISVGFTQGLVDWLNQTASIQVKQAGHGERVRPGWAYVAPDDHHMAITPHRRIQLTRDPPEYGVRPSVAYLFRSVVRAFGANAVGILLTGMGRDGAAELKLMADAGALTIVQDEPSSIVYGMPGEAIRLNAARYVLPPKQIAEKLRHLRRKMKDV